MNLPVYFAFSGAFALILHRLKRINHEPLRVEESDKLRIDSKAVRVFLPDLFSRWPWFRRINPNYTLIKEEVVAWMESFHAFSAKAQDAYNHCNFTLLACLVYPDASKEHARAGADLMHMLFLFHEYSDRSTPSEVHDQKNIILDACRNPHMPRPRGEWVGGEIARQFWERTIRNATQVSQKRLLQNLNEFFEAVLLESFDKKDRQILDVESYIRARRRTIGLKAAFSIYELGFEIPDQVMSHSAVQELMTAAIDMGALTNDVYSYNLEQMRGDDLHNIITCVMHEYHTDVNGAMMWVEAFVRGAEDRFNVALAGLPTWPEPTNGQIRAYCNGLGHFIRGNDDWCFEGERYFGPRGPEMKRSRWMTLLPKNSKSGAEIGPVHVDGSLL